MLRRRCARSESPPAYDPAKENGLDTSKEIKGYKAKYDEATHKITVTLPDKTACVLVYEYQLNDNFSDNTSVSNSASLDGQYSTGGSVSLREVTSSATATQKHIVIYKVDEDDFSNVLSDTYFEMDYWDTASSSWKQKATTNVLKTDDAGKIDYDLEDNDDHLRNDVLYRLRETKAKTGYAANAVRYFIWKNSSSTEDAAYTTSGAANARVDRSAITFFGSNGGKMYVTNEYTRVTVEKVWTDEDGVAKDAPTDASARLALYRYTKKVDSDNSVNVTITAKGTDSSGAAKKLTGDRVSNEGTISIKKGSDFTFRVSPAWGVSFDVYVNDHKYGETHTFTPNQSWVLDPISVTVSNVTSDTTIEVKLTPWYSWENSGTLTEDQNNPWAEPPQILDGTGVQVGDPVDVSSANGWTYNWDNLPKQVDGKDVYYAVKELNYTVDDTTYTPGTGSYDVSYSNNTGIQTGTITVTNSAKKNQGYELPSTGGTPSSLPAVGGAIAFGACALLALRWRRRNG